MYSPRRTRTEHLDTGFRCHAEVLKHHVTTCDCMLEKANETQAFFEDMRVKYRQVPKHHTHSSSPCIFIPLVRIISSPPPLGSSERKKHVVSRFVPLFRCYRSVKGRGQALQFECARLVTEKKRLLEFAEVLNRKLGYFDELEVITQKFHAGRSQVRARRDNSYT
jgi:hypothetical protein